MAYIGSKPADKPVVASDLDPAVITGQTALATAPADTDEFLISDAGVLKRIDASLIGADGITEADMFRLTADFANTNNTISSNLERVDDATFSKIGTGMSLSSGVFTFPTTGLYIVKNFAFLQSNNNVNIALQIQVSSNGGSSFDLVSHMYGGGGFSGELNTTSYQEAFVNVTNASNFKVKFVTVGFSNAKVKGDTDANESIFAFIRLGDSQ